MDLKLLFRLAQTADRQDEFQRGIESELRARLKVLGSGIVSADGRDVDFSSSACAIEVGNTDPLTINILAGTVVFPNGEYTEIGTSDIVGYGIDTTVTEPQVVRLQYGEVEDGPLETNPFYNIAAKPKIRKQTPLEMLVVETVTAYTAQPASVKNLSVVLGVVTFITAGLVADNGRDTYTFSRPWFSIHDDEHRSKIGSGSVSDTNPHGTSPDDLSVGAFSLAQAFLGQPAGILARPLAWGRYPGTICTEVIPAGNFILDATGTITGTGGAWYSPLGFWPHRLLGARLTSSITTKIAAWIPQGRNVVAVWDPANFSAPASLELFYTKVVAGSLPNAFVGASSFDVAQPDADEVLVAGGNFYTELNDTKINFSDVGTIPMRFDIKVDKAGKVYKSPECLYCNTKLDTLGSGAQTFPVQSRAPTRLRVALSGYNPGLTEVRLQLTGTNEAGSTISEQVVFTGPLPAAVPSFFEAPAQWVFTSNVYASQAQIQVLVRNNDGPNTAITVMSENSPTRKLLEDDLLLATLHWSGVQVSSQYSNGAMTALDRRTISRGGAFGGSSPAALNQGALVESVLGGLPAGSTTLVSAVEDFSNPQFFAYPTTDSSLGPVELSNDGYGVRHGYQSRIIPFGATILSADLDALLVRMLPRAQALFPASMVGFQIEMTLYRTGGAPVALTGTLTTRYPPFQVQFSGALPTDSYYGVSFTIPRGADEAELFSGFLFHLRS